MKMKRVDQQDLLALKVGDLEIKKVLETLHRGIGKHDKTKRREVLDRSKKAFRKDCGEQSMRIAIDTLPQRNLYDGYYEGHVLGQNKMNMVFDSVVHSTQRFASRIQSGLFPYKKWCRLNLG